MSCPACEARRRHTQAEASEYHPLAGHGYQERQGWTSQAVKEKHDSEVEKGQPAEWPLDLRVKMQGVTPGEVQSK